MSDISRTSIKKLSHKKWSVLRDLWIGHLPEIDFDAIYPGPTIAQLTELAFPAVGNNGTEVCDQIPGVREAIFREAVLLSRKFIYCGTLLPVLALVGRPTWTAVTAYDAVFYAAKAFCYLLGIASLDRSKPLYLDAFFETEERVGKERKTAYKFRVHKMEERLTHQALWAITQRLIDTSRFEGDLQPLQTKLKFVDWNEFAKFRNKIHYDGGYWPSHEDFANCGLVRQMPRAEEIATLWAGPSLVPSYAVEYFRVGTLLRQLLAGMLQTIADLAPALTSEVSAYGPTNVPQLCVPIAEI